MSETLRLRADALEWRTIEGEVVAVDLLTATYLAVNKSGAKLWDALASGATREQLIDVLVDEFGLAREQATTDAEAFVQMLADQNMLLEE
jgi:hypothetical protein